MLWRVKYCFLISIQWSYWK